MLTTMRMRVVAVGLKVTVRLTRLLPVTLAALTQALPFHSWTSKAVMPYWLKVSVSVGSTQQLGAVVKDAAGNVLPGRTVTWTTTDACSFS